MALLNKSGIINGNTILPAHVTNVYDALNGTGSYDVVATGSFTGSFVGNLTGTATFSNTASFVTASSISGPYGANSVISASYSVSASHLIGGINIDTGSLVTTASFNAYTGSAASQFAGTASFATTASHFTGAIGTGQYIPRWSGSSANSNQLIDSSLYQDTSGNILIGATGTSSARLYIAHSNNGISTINVSATNNTSIYSLNHGPGNFLQFQTGSSTIFNFPTNGNAVLTGSLRITNPTTALSTSGNVIITGSLTATNQILISTGSATAPSYTFINDSNTGIYSSGSTDIIRFATNGADTARIAPQQLIVGDNTFVSNTNYAQAGVQVDGLLYATDGVFHNVFFHPSNYYARGVANKGGIYFQYLNTSSIVAPENGEKIVFRTIPSGSAVGVAVSASDALRIDPNYIDSGEYQPNFEIANRLTLGQLWSGTNTGIGRDSTTGQITAVSSDQRLKTNIQTLTGSLDAIKSLRGTQFEWTNENDPEFRISSDATGTQIGLIAQEVEQILPQVVKPNGVKDYLTVEYDKIVAVLIEAIKEQQQQIDNLQQQINNM